MKPITIVNFYPEKARQRIAIIFALVLSLLLAACGAKPSSAANNLHVLIVPAPEGASGQYLTIQLTDSAGQAITDATVSVEGNMQHAGMAPVTTKGVQDEADGAKDGKYRVPFAFNMLGDWVLTVAVQRADGTKVQQDVPATVSQQGVTVKNANQ